MRKEKLNNIDFNNNNEGLVMEYIEWMNNLRHSLEVVKNVMPEVIRVMQTKADLEHHQDLEIALMPDEAWDILQDNYFKVENKISRYQFDAEFEYGVRR